MDIDRRTLMTGLAASMTFASEAEAASGFYSGTAWYVRGWGSRYFLPAELASRGNNRVWVSKAMIAALDRVRAEVGHPIRILSGYRDPSHNRRIGGAPNSRHIVGDAADIDLSRYDEWARYALLWHLIDNGFTSFGTYGDRPNMLHADMRPRAAIWRHGGGLHPDWLRRALAEWRWEPIGGSPFR
ncbi:MAG: D-Ala-D-Ala carboxypeptidase family metallohydrolase [Pseudomonadota bacterium]